MSSRTIRREFGYYPCDLSIKCGPIRIESLPSLNETVADVTQDEDIENDWIYPGVQQTKPLGGNITTKPYPARVFGLPKTHVIKHASADSEDQIVFHIWALSFFTGIRLTTTEAGFLDATPLRPGKLVDFRLGRSKLTKAVELAERFWVSNRGETKRTKQYAAAIHALFISQYPQHLQFEQFIYLYTALDACFALAEALHPPGKKIYHSDRLSWMCNLFGMEVPKWAAKPAKGAAEVAGIRNATLHEALYMGEPLGFSLHGVGTDQNLPLEMQALICRFLVALIGATSVSYVGSPIHTRQVHSLDL